MDIELFNNIKEEYTNRAKWIDENLTTRERARIDREVALKVVAALVFYILMMAIMEVFL